LNRAPASESKPRDIRKSDEGTNEECEMKDKHSKERTRQKVKRQRKAQEKDVEENEQQKEHEKE